MKNIIKSFLAIVTVSIAISCSDDTEIAPFKPLIFSEDFPEADINLTLKAGPTSLKPELNFG